MRNLIPIEETVIMIVIRKNELLEESYNHFPLSNYFSFDISPYTSMVKFDSTESSQRNNSHYALHML